jgi:hypothetical protein
MSHLCYCATANHRDSQRLFEHLQLSTPMMDSGHARASQIESADLVFLNGQPASDLTRPADP